MAQQVRDPELLQLWQRSQLWLGLDPWPGTGNNQKKRKKEKRDSKSILL